MQGFGLEDGDDVAVDVDRDPTRGQLDLVQAHVRLGTGPTSKVRNVLGQIVIARFRGAFLGDSFRQVLLFERR